MVKKVTTLVTALKPEKDISHIPVVVDEEEEPEEAGPAMYGQHLSAFLFFQHPDIIIFILCVLHL